MTMTANKVTHTPGPWRVIGGCSTPHDRDGGFDFGIIADVPKSGEPAAEREPVVMAETYGRVGYAMYLNSEANARLIAAAPELLAVAQLVVAICESGNVEHARLACDENIVEHARLACDENSPLVDAARAAIAKAEGRS